MAARVRRKGRAKVGWIILGILVVVVVVGLGALAFTEGERREGRSLPIAAVDFVGIADGTYRGKYAGGRYGWRANEVEVTVSSGKITSIEVAESTDRSACGSNGKDITSTLFGRVIEAQSLQVDVVSQATITSKSFLKSVENALLGATSGL